MGWLLIDILMHKLKIYYVYFPSEIIRLQHKSEGVKINIAGASPSLRSHLKATQSNKLNEGFMILTQMHQRTCIHVRNVIKICIQFERKILEIQFLTFHRLHLINIHAAVIARKKKRTDTF